MPNILRGLSMCHMYCAESRYAERIARNLDMSNISRGILMCHIYCAESQHVRCIGLNLDKPYVLRGILICLMYCAESWFAVCIVQNPVNMTYVLREISICRLYYAVFWERRVSCTAEPLECNLLIRLYSSPCSYIKRFCFNPFWHTILRPFELFIIWTGETNLWYPIKPGESADEHFQ